jgi:hypothetical protein
MQRQQNGLGWWGEICFFDCYLAHDPTPRREPQRGEPHLGGPRLRHKLERADLIRISIEDVKAAREGRP